MSECEDFFQTLLFKAIILVLIFLTAVSLVFYLFNVETNLSTNLFSEFISIIVTVVIIKWLYERHMEQQWTGTEKRISKRIENIIIIYSRILRLGLDLPLTVDYEGLERNKEHIKIYEESINTLKLSKEKLSQLKLNISWNKIMVEISEFEKHLDKIMRSFEPKLNSRQHELLMDLEETLEKLQRNLEAYEDQITPNWTFEEDMVGEVNQMIDNLLELDKTRKLPNDMG
jgi:hypothetical protein